MCAPLTPYISCSMCVALGRFDWEWTSGVIYRRVVVAAQVGSYVGKNEFNSAVGKKESYVSLVFGHWQPGEN